MLFGFVEPKQPHAIQAMLCGFVCYLLFGFSLFAYLYLLKTIGSIRNLAFCNPWETRKLIMGTPCEEEPP